VLHIAPCCTSLRVAHRSVLHIAPCCTCNLPPWRVSPCHPAPCGRSSLAPARLSRRAPLGAHHFRTESRTESFELNCRINFSNQFLDAGNQRSRSTRRRPRRLRRRALGTGSYPNPVPGSYPNRVPGSCLEACLEACLESVPRNASLRTRISGVRISGVRISGVRISGARVPSGALCAATGTVQDLDRPSTAPPLRVSLQKRVSAQEYLLRGKTNQEQPYTPTYWGAASSKPQSMGNWEDKVGGALRRSPVIHRPSTGLQQLIACSRSASSGLLQSTPSAPFSSPFSSLGMTVAARSARFSSRAALRTGVVIHNQADRILITVLEDRSAPGRAAQSDPGSRRVPRESPAPDSRRAPARSG
jgi:hypothetical protein